MTQKEDIDFKEFESMSYENALDYNKAILLGQPQSGKTLAAATMSKYFPSTKDFKILCEKIKQGKKPPPVFLKDAYWLSFDWEATNGLLQFGFFAETISYQSLIKKGYNAPKAVMIMLKAAQNAVENRNKKLVVVDTISQASLKLQNFYTNKKIPKSKSGGEDTMKGWGKLLGKNLDIQEKITALRCHAIFCCHTEVRQNKETVMAAIKETTKRKNLAKATPGSAELEMNIKGASQNQFRNDISLVIALTTKIKNGEIVREFDLDNTNLGGAEKKIATNYY